MKAVVFTLGCKVNEYESDSLIHGLMDRGYEVSDRLEYADLYIVNTCAVTAEAEKKSRQTSARIKKINPNARVIFTGCATEKNPKPFMAKQNASLVTGTFSKNKILDLLDQEGVHIFPQTREYEDLLSAKTLRTRAFIKVQDGCDNFCTYCIIPYLRGRSRSREPQKIIDEINELKPKEAVINGINLSAYNYNGTNLTDLMRKLKCVDCRIRLGSLEVNVIDNDFLSSLRELKDFAPHFHLSLQSGSNNVLKKMNRHYTSEEFIEKVDLIREYFPDAGITTDIIVGFPTETEEDFNETLNLVERVNFSDIHPFIFSPRSGTVAYKMPDLSPSIKKERMDILLEKKAICKTSFARKMIGKTFGFIYEEDKEGFGIGYLGNYLRTYIKGYNLQKDKTLVKVIDVYKDGVIAELV